MQEFARPRKLFCINFSSSEILYLSRHLVLTASAGPQLYNDKLVNYWQVSLYTWALLRDNTCGNDRLRHFLWMLDWIYNHLRTTSVWNNLVLLASIIASNWHSWQPHAVDFSNIRWIWSTKKGTFQSNCYFRSSSRMWGEVDSNYFTFPPHPDHPALYFFLLKCAVDTKCVVCLQKASNS